MTWRFSTGLRNALAQSVGFAGALNRGYINLYTGSQPVTADAAFSGTLLLTFSASSGALTKETRATGSFTIAGASGSIDTITVGGLNIIPDGTVPFNTTLNQTASDVAAAINRNGMFEATVSSATVTLMGRRGTGVTTAAVSGSGTTLTVGTLVNMGSSIAGIAPVNALILASPAAGVIAKPATQVWSGVGVAAGTAGWGRFFASAGNDSGAAISVAPFYPRLDGSCGVGSGDFQLSTLAIVVNLPVTLDTFQVTMPAA